MAIWTEDLRERTPIRMTIIVSGTLTNYTGPDPESLEAVALRQGLQALRTDAIVDPAAESAQVLQADLRTMLEGKQLLVTWTFSGYYREEPIQAAMRSLVAVLTAFPMTATSKLMDLNVIQVVRDTA